MIYNNCVYITYMEMCTEIKTNPSLLGSFPCFTTVCFITGPWWYEMAPQARCVNTWSLASGAVWRFYRPFRRKLVTGDSPCAFTACTICCLSSASCVWSQCSPRPRTAVTMPSLPQRTVSLQTVSQDKPSPIKLLLVRKVEIQQ